MKLLTWISVVVVIAVGLAVYLYTTAPHATVSQTATSTPAVSFYCANGKTIAAQFASSTASLALSDGRTLVLPQVMSGSGIRYEASTTGSDVLFSGKGDYAALSENGTDTFASCVAAHISASDAPGYNTYADEGNTFSFAYPTNFEIAAGDASYTQGWATQATTTGLVLATIVVPKSVQPGTNFGDAKFTIGTSADPPAVALCETNLSGLHGSATTTAVGGVSMTKRTFSDAAAGNRYDTTSYRVVRDSQCYAIEYTIHYGVFQNYPKGTVKEFDEAGLAASLDKMARSFEFTGN